MGKTVLPGQGLDQVLGQQPDAGIRLHKGGLLAGWCGPSPIRGRGWRSRRRSTIKGKVQDREARLVSASGRRDESRRRATRVVPVTTRPIATTFAAW